jgi:hypothetical protein
LLKFKVVTFINVVALFRIYHGFKREAKRDIIV